MACVAEPRLCVSRYETDASPRRLVMAFCLAASGASSSWAEGSGAGGEGREGRRAAQPLPQTTRQTRTTVQGNGKDVCRLRRPARGNGRKGRAVRLGDIPEAMMLLEPTSARLVYPHRGQRVQLCPQAIELCLFGCIVHRFLVDARSI